MIPAEVNLKFTRCIYTNTKKKRLSPLEPGYTASFKKKRWNSLNKTKKEEEKNVNFVPLETSSHEQNQLTFSSIIHSNVTNKRSKVTNRQKVLLTSDIPFFSLPSQDSILAMSCAGLMEWKSRREACELWLPLRAFSMSSGRWFILEEAWRSLHSTPPSLVGSNLQRAKEKIHIKPILGAYKQATLTPGRFSLTEPRCFVIRHLSLERGKKRK